MAMLAVGSKLCLAPRLSQTLWLLCDRKMLFWRRFTDRWCESCPVPKASVDQMAGEGVGRASVKDMSRCRLRTEREGVEDDWESGLRTMRAASFRRSALPLRRKPTVQSVAFTYLFKGTFSIYPLILPTFLFTPIAQNIFMEKRFLLNYSFYQFGRICIKLKIKVIYL